ncbi:MAG: hypothetical protein KGJ23_04410 [Euryarchaeota archaeon]|nr:hypothetical protein [Euryarchaeota archaeon]MDE1835843.1 hypothetical protein [Euryarchaeota archaeon]MDE1880506.1 hypothetical protein [Euryarchaeota archaeon]MDE2045817.1 hypothetical protein [Thermoplasmata archaeon]
MRSMAEGASVRALAAAWALVGLLLLAPVALGSASFRPVPVGGGLGSGPAASLPALNQSNASAWGISCAPVVLGGLSMTCVAFLNLTELLLLFITLAIVVYVYRGARHAELPGDAVDFDVRTERPFPIPRQEEKAEPSADPEEEP